MGKLTAIIFCVLVVNIFAHDLHSRHHAEQFRHLRHNSKENSKESSHEKPDKPKDPSWQGNRGRQGTNSQLSFSYNSTTNVESIYNNTGKSGAVQDLKTSIVIIFNDRTRVAIALNYKSNMGVCFHNNTIKNWSSILLNVTSLQHVVEAGKKHGEVFNATSPPANVSKEAKPILKSLGTNKTNIPEFLPELQNSANIFKQYSHWFGSFRSLVHGDYSSICKRLQGLGQYLSGLNSRFNGNASFNADNILNHPTGVNVLNEILHQLGRNNVSLPQILGNASTSESGLTSLIDGLGNGATSGDATFHEINQLFQPVTFIPRVFISTFIEGVTYGPRIFLSGARAVVTGFASLSRIPLTIFGTSASTFVTVARGVAGRYTPLFHILDNPQSSPISNLVQFFSHPEVFQRVSLRQSIPEILGQLINSYNSSNSINPSLQSLLNFGGSGNINYSSSVSSSLQNVPQDFLKLIQGGAGIFVTFPLIALHLGRIPLSIFIGPIATALSRYSNESFLDIFQNNDALHSLLQSLNLPQLQNGTSPLNIEGSIQNIGYNLGNNVAQSVGGGNSNKSSENNDIGKTVEGLAHNVFPSSGILPSARLHSSHQDRHKERRQLKGVSSEDEKLK